MIYGTFDLLLNEINRGDSIDFNEYWADPKLEKSFRQGTCQLKYWDGWNLFC